MIRVCGRRWKSSTRAVVRVGEFGWTGAFLIAAILKDSCGRAWLITLRSRSDEQLTLFELNSILGIAGSTLIPGLNFVGLKSIAGIADYITLGGITAAGGVSQALISDLLDECCTRCHRVGKDCLV